MTESQNGPMPLQDPWTVGPHGVLVPPWHAHRKSPPADRSKPAPQDRGQSVQPDDASGGTREPRAIALEPLASSLAETRNIRLAPSDGGRRDAPNDHWVMGAIWESIPVPVQAAPTGPWFRTVLLLLMLALLSAVAFWTPARLQTLAASTMELLISTDIPESRTAPGPAPLVGQLDVTSAPTGIELYVDGELHGVTPMQLVLHAGTHQLMFVSPIGKVSRKVRVRPSHRTLFSEAIFPGSLVISSEATVEVQIDGAVIGPSSDRELLLAPGSYQVDLVNPENGLRSTHRVEILPGQGTIFDARAPRGT